MHWSNHQSLWEQKVNTSLHTYIDTLRAQAAEAAKHKAEADAHCGSTRNHEVKPLTDQIEALMRSLPPAQRDRPWSMAELVCRLQGRYRDRPHAADVGQALRALGWTRKRDWTSEGGGRRVWVVSS